MIPVAFMSLNISTQHTPSPHLNFTIGRIAHIPSKWCFFFILCFTIDTYPCPVETTGADLAVHEGAGRSLDRRGKSADAHPWGK